VRLRWWPAIATGFVLLLAGTVMVFEAFDRSSHSVSDTLRPFLITMTPVWLVAIAGAVAVLRPGSK
jgi:putative Mn2+ efflux pump MntP